MPTSETAARISLSDHLNARHTAVDGAWWPRSTDLAGDGLVLGDEVLTPDSSRFWPATTWTPGAAQPSFDKQYVRDWLTASGWDRVSPPPELPDDVVAATRERYVTAYEQLTGSRFV